MVKGLKLIAKINLFSFWPVEGGGGGILRLGVELPEPMGPFLYVMLKKYNLFFGKRSIVSRTSII